MLERPYVRLIAEQPTLLTVGPPYPLPAHIPQHALIERVADGDDIDELGSRGCVHEFPCPRAACRIAATVLD